MSEQCKNPLNPNCPNKDVVVYLQIGQDKIPIYPKCWIEIADSNVEWDEIGLKTQ